MRQSRLLSFILLFMIGGVIIVQSQQQQRQAVEENEFAEFEDPDDVSSNFGRERQQHNEKQQPGGSSKQKPPPSAEPSSNAESGDQGGQDAPAQKNINDENVEKKVDDSFNNVQVDSRDDDDSTLETEDDEFIHLTDTEEFEGFDKDRMGSSGKKEGKPDLKIAKVPHHLTTSWENFYLEMLMLTGLVVYFLNFLVGRTKNARLANAWFASHKELLEANFSIVGDDGQATPNTGVLMKDSEHIYSLWCSGRVCCEGMLVELRFLKRQDLVSVISGWLKPANDTIVVKVVLDEGEMDGFVMALATKKRAGHLVKDFQDLATFCPEKKTVKQSIPDNFVLFSEIGEATTAILDTSTCKFLRDFEDRFEYIHFSDQYTGQRIPQEEGQTNKIPDFEAALVFAFKVGRKGMTSVNDMEAVKPLFQFVFYMVDKIKRIKLSKEAKQKSEKNRQKAMESYQKLVHSQRQEAAQVRREEKRRVDKEKLLSEEDPEKARKMEERDSKREQKRKQPKMKMMKVKGM